MTPPRFLTGHHPTRGLLWAAIDADARFLNADIAEGRFGAYLSPFTDEADARAALIDAGAMHVEAEQRSRNGHARGRG